jgi:hypothetical protein
MQFVVIPMFFLKHLLILFFALSSSSALSRPLKTLKCVENMNITPSLRAVGVETIHKTATSIVTIMLPLPISSDQGRIFDLNALGSEKHFSQRTAISDGSLKSAFISLDLQSSSRLSQCINEMSAQVQERIKSGIDVYPVLTTFISEYLAMAPEGFRFPWDPQEEIALPPEFKQAAPMKPGHAPLLTTLVHPTVPLEGFLLAQRGACLQKVLLTSLIMRNLQISHRVRAGAFEATGHIWIELPDGRILDPTWQHLGYPTTHGALPGWFRFDQNLLYQYQLFPFAAN